MSFFAPSSGDSSGPVYPTILRKWPKTSFISVHVFLSLLTFYVVTVVLITRTRHSLLGAEGGVQIIPPQGHIICCGKISTGVSRSIIQ